MNKKNQSTFGVVAGILIALSTFGFVFFLLVGTNTPPTYTFSDNSLVISGQYGKTIDLTDASVVHEQSLVPQPELKTNGAAMGKIKKGSFSINGTKVYLNIMDKDAMNFILITDKNGSLFYINCETVEKTNELYDDIVKNAINTN